MIHALFLILLLPEPQALSNTQMRALEKRNYEIVSSLTIRGAEAPLVSEVLNNCARIFNALSVEEKKVEGEKEDKAKE